MDINIEKYHLKSTSLFDLLSKEEVQLIKSKIIIIDYIKGTLLFAEDSYSRGIYIVKKGKIKIFKTSSEGKNSIVYIYKKGDFFGYRPLLAGEPHPVSAVAMDNVTVSFIPKEIFQSILTQSSNLARILLEVLSQEFSVWINKMTVFAQYGVKERVALSLLILNRVYQKQDETNPNMTIQISREDLASYVGTAKETLVRMLRNFKNENIISSKGSKIIIIRYDELLAMVTNLK
jgi:CRP-like cAMP-binding protein